MNIKEIKEAKEISSSFFTKRTKSIFKTSAIENAYIRKQDNGKYSLSEFSLYNIAFGMPQDFSHPLKSDLTFIEAIDELAKWEKEKYNDIEYDLIDPLNNILNVNDAKMILDAIDKKRKSITKKGFSI